MLLHTSISLLHLPLAVALRLLFMRDQVSLALGGRYVGTWEYHDMIHVHTKVTPFHVFDTGYGTSRSNSAANVWFPILRSASLVDVGGGMRRIKRTGFKWTAPLL
jgi:hypothetical protein